MRSGSAIVIHDDEEEKEEEEEEEQHGLLKLGSSSSASPQEAGRRCGVRGWKQRLAILGLTAVAFVAGYIVHASTAAAGSSFPSLRHPIAKSGNDAIVVATNDDNNDEPMFNATFTTYLLTGMSNVLAKRQNGHTTIPPYERTYYVYDSPYTLRWPCMTKPTWVKKIIPYNYNIPRSKQICFVHVGKAGGSTIGCMLGFNLHCDESSQTNNNDNHGGSGSSSSSSSSSSSNHDIIDLLPIVTTHTFHREVNDCVDDSHYYLFTLRDPVARILSAYNYERPNSTDVRAHKSTGFFPRGKLYDECHFPTLEELAQKGLLNKKKDPLSIVCHDRAMNAIMGIRPYMAHGYYNYQYYAQFAFGTRENHFASTTPDDTAKSANVLVIRNEHIAHDWNQISILLDGKMGTLNESNVPKNNPTLQKLPNEKYLSNTSKAVLCEVLCNEIQIYKGLIRTAINLNVDDRELSMQELQSTCPKEAVEDGCKYDIPDIYNKIESEVGASALSYMLD